MEGVILNATLLAVIVAMVLVAYEMRASLRPAECAECPHCRSLVNERARRQRDLQAEYAREHHLDTDEDDDRRI